MEKRDLAMVLLLVCCLGILLFAKSPTIGSVVYDPWADVTGPIPGVPDGRVDMRDIGYVASRFGSSGNPGTRAMQTFDSGWVNISSVHGQNISISHNLGIQNWDNESIIASITGRTEENTSLLRYTGLSTEDMVWNRTYGGGGANSMIKTSDGGCALLGTEYSTGESSFWLVKTDSRGIAQWNESYKNSPADPYCLVQAHDGGYVLIGTTYDAETGADVCIIKTGSQGTVEWAKTYGGDGEQYGYSILAASDGGYVFAGSIKPSGLVSFDFYAGKIDRNGNLNWSRAYGGTGNEQAHCVCATSDGGYALAGETYSLGAGQNDFWLIKTDSDGMSEWNRTYGGAGSEIAQSVIETLHGGYALAGQTSSFGTVGGDFYLVKTDSAGKMQWNKTYGGAYYDYANSVVQTFDESYVLAGTTNSFGAGLEDFWLVKTDYMGKMMWNRTYGGSDSEDAYCGIVVSDQTYAIAGFTGSYEPFGMWLIEVDMNAECGLVWVDTTANTILVYRGELDPYWNYVRLQIWQKK